MFHTCSIGRWTNMQLQNCPSKEWPAEGTQRKHYNTVLTTWRPRLYTLIFETVFLRSSYENMRKCTSHKKHLPCVRNGPCLERSSNVDNFRFSFCAPAHPFSSVSAQSADGAKEFFSLADLLPILIP